MPKCHGCKKIFCETDMDGSRCKKCKEKHQQSYHKNKEVKSGYCVECFLNGILKKASYGFESDMKRVSCSEHKIEGMYNLQDRNKMCANCIKEGIQKLSTYGYLTDMKKISCSKHKNEGMVDLTHKNNFCIICAQEGKVKRASYGFESDMKKISCSEHKVEGMTDLTNKNLCDFCTKNGIIKRASYGFESDMKKVACSEHKMEGMVDLTIASKICLICKEQGKIKIASFGYLTDMKKISCSEHKIEGMHNLVFTDICVICDQEGNFKRASYGFESDMKKISCSEHKMEGMVDLVNITNICLKCKEEGITKLSSFGFESDMKKVSCSKHKLPGMINIMDKNKLCVTCSLQGKIKISSYGFATDKKKISCSEHKAEGMIDLTHRNNMCIVCNQQGKQKIAGFGLLFEKKTHCLIHKTPNMYSKNNPMCSECPERPYYGDEKLDEIPVRCETHKKDTDIDMISKPCQGGCGLTYFIPSGQTMCRGCLGWERKTTNRGVKERKIATLLESMKDILGNPVNNSMVTGGCSRHRPDFFYKDYNPYFHLIVEVDEFQHSKYSCSIQGEINRLINISENDTGGFPICVVRFNPDPYYYKEKTMKAYRGREETLKKVLLGLKNRTEFMHQIGVIYLYYDEYDETKGCKIEPLVYKTRSDGMLIVRHKHPCNVNPVYKSKL